MIDQQFANTLKQNRLFLTNERIQIFTILKSLKAPCSINQLVKLSQQYADRSTVYRSLEIFERINVVKRVYSGWKYKIELSDDFSDHHHHMTCTSCNSVQSFHESSEFTLQLQKLEKQYGFLSDSHNLELRGLCANCRK